MSASDVDPVRTASGRLKRWLASPWRYLLLVGAVPTIVYLHLVASTQIGQRAYWLVGLVLLTVGLVVGFGAWLVAIVLSVGAILVLPVISLPGAAWDTSEVVQLPPLVMDDPEEPGLVQLRSEYHLDEVVAGAKNDHDRVVLLTSWASNRFRHSSDNRPSNPDPMTILREADAGQRFRCVEYSIVVAASARSLGMHSRLVGLKRQDVDTARYGASHVVAEVWLRDEARWVMADGQWGALIEIDGRLLSSVEVRQAVASRRFGLRVVPGDGIVPPELYYPSWLASYLYYSDYALDQRFFGSPDAKHLGQVMLVPRGAPEPRVMGRVSPTDDYIYVRNPNLFYRAPE